MAMQNIIYLVLVIILKVNGDLLSKEKFTPHEFSDEVDARLPRLFHLDDHDRCLLQKDGLYCLGVFELSPIYPSPVYDIIEVYSSHSYAFNRSRLHRGYCVSARCPSKRSELNSTLRFEQCVDKRARPLALSARLHTLHYCTTQEEYKVKMEQPPDAAKQLFTQIVYAFLVLNLVGTVYDILTGDSKNKIKILTIWSIRASWRRLTGDFDIGDPRIKELEPLHGGRVVAMLFTIYGHCMFMHLQYFVTNPVFLENLFYNRYDGILLANGTSLMQMFLMISTFLTAYNMLINSQTNKMMTLPNNILKRMARLAPVHLLLVGYAATWWPDTRSGALSGILKENSEVCRNKFWTHIFFLNNVVEKYDVCLLPTWYIAVDMQLYIVTCILTIVMCRRRQQALRLYAMLFVISATMCGVISYFTGWQAMVYRSLPEFLRGFSRNDPSFAEFYISPWGSSPALFAGLFMAHLHFELQEKKYNYAGNKWLTRMQHWCLPALIVWIIVVGSFIKHYKHPLVTAAYVAIDKPIFCCFFFCAFFCIVNLDGPLRKFFGWRGWKLTARLSLPIMLCHWLIAQVISARPAAYQSSRLAINMDYLAVVFYTHLVSVLISLLVEIPVQRSISLFL